MDFHCHLDFKEYDNQRKTIIEDCFKAGFSRIVTVGDPYENGSYERTIECLRCHPQVYCMAGAHPHNADRYSPEIERTLIAFITENNAAGLGEAGLDFHYNLSTPGNQRRIFRRQVDIAKELKIPLIIHSRKAENEILDILRESGFNGPAVFHCYTGNMDDAKKILELGYYISISGIVTFKNADTLREIVKIIPLDRIFTETDSPYLAPIPHRGKTNTPLWVILVAQKIAEIKEIPVEELNTAINENFTRLIGHPRGLLS